MDISRKVKELISYHSGVKLEKLLDSDFVEEDLGTTGDDAWELMEDLQSKFKVDLTEFNFDLHFGPEVGSQVSRDYGFYPVSVGHLVEVARKQKWVVPEKNEGNYARTQKARKKWKLVKILLIAASICLGIAWSYIN